MPVKPKQRDIIKTLVEQNYLFRDFSKVELAQILDLQDLAIEKLYSNRPIYTAYRPGLVLQFLYLVVSGGPVIVRCSPLDRIIAIHYPGACFGPESLPIGFGPTSRGFPSLVEAYKTTDVVKVPVSKVQQLYEKDQGFCDRYNLLFELRQKFQYHLLNCSTYPPQAVAALLRALIYQERELGSQPDAAQTYRFDLPLDLIALASQLNQRTVEQVLKGMRQNGLIETAHSSDLSGDMIRVLDPEGMKEIYSTTRDKVSWWPLK
ncbi:MAG: Crp/Fnr family transcriptional regulator [Acaryochloris sp. RU_4_1]|nr:Crp/Fnr family transcriptional regulator [Acaryochloris sp. RU_4_1]NJR56113.1 Crp/Fnr family transcriptional regulator [Acaryochloris sp. CRU_2_0]